LARRAGRRGSVRLAGGGGDLEAEAGALGVGGKAWLAVERRMTMTALVEQALRREITPLRGQDPARPAVDAGKLTSP
jgi:hypothetical protein